MKSAESKTATAAQPAHAQEHAQEPFFQKDGQGSFFSEETKQAGPFFSPQTVQPKLRIGKPNDKYEQEADAMAEKVVGQLSGNTPAPAGDTSATEPAATKTGAAGGHSPSTVQTQTAAGPEEQQEKSGEEEGLETETGIQRKAIFESNEDAPEAEVQTKAAGVPGVQAMCAECAQEEEVKEKEENDSGPGEGPLVQRMCAECAAEAEEEPKEKLSSFGDGVQRMCAECAAEEENTQTAADGREKPEVQTKAESPAPTATPDLQSRLSSTKGSGQPLPADTRSSMESGFGTDFSGVRVHTDNEAAQMNKDLGAHAFTHGSDIYFNEGKYDTGSSEGKKLLAHELTHTVQQGGRRNNMISKTEDCEADEEESGSEEQAAQAETAPNLGNCSITNPPAEQPPEGTEEPSEEPRPAEVGADEGAPVDERQSNAPPPDENAPDREEGIEEQTQGEGDEQPQDPCAIREGIGAGQQGNQPAEGAITSLAGGDSAGAGSGPTGGGEASEAASETSGEGGQSASTPANNATSFLAEAATNSAQSNVQPEGLGEAASPEVSSEREAFTISAGQATSILETNKTSISNLTTGSLQYALPKETPADSAAYKTAQENRTQSSALVSAFLSNAANRLLAFIDNSKSSTELLRAETMQKKARAQAEIEQRKAQTTTVYDQLREQARANANSATQRIENRHLATLATIEIKAALANLQVAQSYTTNAEALELARIAQFEVLDQVYETAYDNLIGIGNRMGEQAISRAQEHERSYRIAENEPDPEKKRLVENDEADGFWDGYLTVNRYEARADAAKEVGEQYQEGFRDQAQAQADNMMCGKPQDIELTNAFADQGLESLACARDNALDSIALQRQGALMQAQLARQQMIDTIQASLSATITQLDQQEASQLQLLNDYGIRQELAIDRDTERAIGSVLQGVNDGSSKILEYLIQFHAGVQSSEAPAPEEVSAQLVEENTQLDGSFAAIESAFEQSMAQAQSSLDSAEEQAMFALQQLYQQGETDGYTLGSTFSATIEGLIANAIGSYDQLDTNYDQVIQGEVESGSAMLTAIVSGITGLYTQTSSSLQANFEEAALNTERGMQDTLNNDLDNKICAQAEQAAADVQPWWKGVLKVLVIILVIVVVALVIGPAVIGAVGAMAASLAGSLGAGAALAGTIGAWAGPIIGGAIVGALSGAVIQVSNNLIDIAGTDRELSWDSVTKGVWGAMIAGAIGGALGGLGGQFAQVIMGRLGAGLSAGWQFAANFGIEAAFDVVGGILGDLAAGNPITWESIVMGLAIGGAVQLSMGGLSGLARRSAANADAGLPTTRLGRLASGITDFQGRMMGVGENFGARLGAIGPNAPSVSGTRQALAGARARIEEGEALPIRGGEEPEGWRRSPMTEPIRGGDEVETRTSNRPSEPEPEGSVPRDVVEETPGTKFRSNTGDDITVTREGPLVRCFNPCELIEIKYRDIIQENPNIARDIELAKQYAEFNEPLARAKAQDALDALEGLRALEVSQRLHGIVDDVNAQNGLARLAQHDNDLFNSLVASASPENLARFGRILQANPNLTAELATMPRGLVNEIGSSPRLQRWIAANSGDLPRLRSLYDDYTRPRPAGEELASGDFAEYVGRRGVAIGSDVEPVQGVPRDNLPEAGSEAHQRWQDYIEGRSPIPCFPTGTIIKTPFGDRLIENIAKGDIVYSYDFHNKEQVVAKVEQVYTNWSQHLIEINSKNQIVKSTKNHHFWVESKSGWLRADNLKKNMKIRYLDGNPATIMSIEHVDQQVITFNFKVEIYHNYYVGGQGCLVHNDNGESISTSRFADTMVYPSTIYVLTDINTGQVIYVGQTRQPIDVRFNNHLTNPESSVFQYLRDNYFPQMASDPNFLSSSDMRQYFDVERPINNKLLTPYELSVWEQYHIQRNGGLDALMNRRNEITQETLERYMNLHNPCQ